MATQRLPMIQFLNLFMTEPNIFRRFVTIAGENRCCDCSAEEAAQQSYVKEDDVE